MAPPSASSGRTTSRHRLSRSGDRAADSALYIIAIVRTRRHEPTRAYVERHTAEGLSKREIIRCLKRYIAERSTPTCPPQQLDKRRSIERFHRTLATEWAYARPYESESERADAYRAWLHDYTHHRAHSGTGGLSPIDRVRNVPKSYN